MSHYDYRALLFLRTKVCDIQAGRTETSEAQPLATSKKRNRETKAYTAFHITQILSYT